MEEQAQNMNFTPFPKLSTDRLLLRQLSTDDAKELFSLRSDEEVNRYIDRQAPENLDEIIEFVHKINKGIRENTLLYWAISLKDQKTLIGTICLFNFSADNTTAETGYELHPDFQKKGIMNEAFQAVMSFVKKQLSFQVIEAFVHKNNSGSIKLLENNNFVDTGRFEDEQFIVYNIDGCNE